MRLGRRVLAARIETALLAFVHTPAQVRESDQASGFARRMFAGILSYRGRSDRRALLDRILYGLPPFRSREPRMRRVRHELNALLAGHFGCGGQPDRYRV